jgi:hypothetical protein
VILNWSGAYDEEEHDEAACELLSTAAEYRGAP